MMSLLAHNTQKMRSMSLSGVIKEQTKGTKLQYGQSGTPTHRLVLRTLLQTPSKKVLRSFPG